MWTLVLSFCCYNIVQYKYTKLSFSKNPQHSANTLWSTVNLFWLCGECQGEQTKFEVDITDLP